MKFIVLIRAKKEPGHVVQSPSHFEAQKFMCAKLGVSPAELEVMLTGETAIENIDLTWMGSDAGTHPDRKLYVRERAFQNAPRPTAWSEWRPA